MLVSAGSKRSWTVSAEAKYDGQSLQEAKISGLVNPTSSRGINFNTSLFDMVRLLGFALSAVMHPEDADGMVVVLLFYVHGKHLRSCQLT